MTFYIGGRDYRLATLKHETALFALKTIKPIVLTHILGNPEGKKAVTPQGIPTCTLVYPSLTVLHTIYTNQAALCPSPLCTSLAPY